MFTSSSIATKSCLKALTRASMTRSMCKQTFNFQHLLLKPVHDSPFRTFSVTSPRATGDVKDLGKRQRKLLYRCKQRGLLELDLLLGIPSVL